MKRLANLTMVGIFLFGCLLPVFAQDTLDANGAEAKKVDFKKLKSPVPYTAKSIKRGKMWYTRECTSCHGPNGKALIDIIADATDLTNTKMWYSGSTEGEIFRSIRDGAGVAMPPYKSKIRKEEDLWHLVNFVRSLWPKAQRPKLVEDKSKSTESKTGEPSSNAGEDDHE